MAPVVSHPVDNLRGREGGKEGGREREREGKRGREGEGEGGREREGWRERSPIIMYTWIESQIKVLCAGSSEVECN